MSLPLLLEIGTEEIPDWMIESALKQFGDSVQQLLDTNQLGGKVAWTDATPRRLALRAEDVIERQPDAEEVVKGPPMKAGQSAVVGFAKKMGVAVEALENDGTYYSFRRDVTGRAALEILAEALPALILKIQWPKTMYWAGKNGPRFIRPIRWLVAILGPDVIPFEIAGVKAGRVTRGHRRLGKQAITVTTEN
jgi:glycyl-tRNA synthetase beta chain